MSIQNKLSDSFLKDLAVYEAEQASKAIKLPLLYAIDMPAGVYLKAYEYPGEGIAFRTTDGHSIKLNDYHQQDCCESVYTDFRYAEPFLQQDFSTQVWNRLEVLGIVGLGFVIKLSQDGQYSESVSFTFPCYNSQNGYYSGALDLIVEYSRYPDAKTEVNLSNYVLDQID